MHTRLHRVSGALSKAICSGLTEFPLDAPPADHCKQQSPGHSAVASIKRKSLCDAAMIALVKGNIRKRKVIYEFFLQGKHGPS